MRILFLSPQPLYQDRGSSIANKLIIEVLSRRGDETDVITFAEGKNIEFDHITLHRTADLPFLRGIRPGFSFKKIIADILLFFIALRLVQRNRYDVIHAVEESAFIAMFFKLFFRIPYVYDMDSSMAQQMVEKYPSLSAISGILDYFEGRAIRGAKAVIVVCDALGDIAKKHHPQKLVTLRDVPLLDDVPQEIHEDLREILGISGPIAMYVGNLESYQGIDLLVEAFAITAKQVPDAHLVIIGGTDEHIAQYKKKVETLGISDQTHLIGPRPIQELGMYLAQADLLVSPRTKGNNTPMKIYSYMYSGKPTVATDLWTHTQVLDDTVAVLTDPTPEAYAAGLTKLLQDVELRAQLGQRGVELITEKYSYSVFLQSLTELLDWLKEDTRSSKSGALPSSVQS